LEEQGIPCLSVREPGGTTIGDAVRLTLLDPKHIHMKLQTETLLYAASRAQLVEEVIQPALSKGSVVLCDRYIDSSIVYQGYAPASGNISDVIRINRFATKGLYPCRTYLLDISMEVFEERLQSRGRGKDRMEQKEIQFHQRVRDGYLALAKAQSERFVVVDATKEPDKVLREILDDLLPLVKRRSMCLV
jgi:dTMP kinase